jgi:hypothetical protein
MDYTLEDATERLEEARSIKIDLKQLMDEADDDIRYWKKQVKICSAAVLKA